MVKESERERELTGESSRPVDKYTGQNIDLFIEEFYYNYWTFISNSTVAHPSVPIVFPQYLIV